jgi:hypothetical protein
LPRALVARVARSRLSFDRRRAEDSLGPRRRSLRVRAQITELDLRRARTQPR